MEITQVKVFPVEEERLKAYVSIVLDDCFLVSDLKVIQGPNGVFVSMPSKRKKNGERAARTRSCCTCPHSASISRSISF